MGSDFGPQKSTKNWSWAAAVPRTLTLTPTLTPWNSDFFENFWFFEISGKVFAWFGRKIFFKPKFFWRRRAGLGPGGPKTCLFPVFETYGFLPGGFLDGSEFCPQPVTTGTTAHNTVPLWNPGVDFPILQHMCSRSQEKTTKSKLFWQKFKTFIHKLANVRI